METRTRLATAAAALVLGTAAAPFAGACALDGLADEGFPHGFGMPRSFAHRMDTPPEAAPGDFAPRFTLAPPAAALPLPTDARTLERIGPRLRAMHRLLETVSIPVRHASVAVLSVDSGRWTRFSRTGPVVQVLADAEGPVSGDLVIRAGAWALGEVLERRVPLRAAVESGLVAIDSDTITAAALRHALVESLS